jgi:hypothetical protein
MPLPTAEEAFGAPPPELPTAEQAFGPEPAAMPEGFHAGNRFAGMGADSDALWDAAEPIGRVLRQFGQGVSTAWEGGENLGYSDDVNDAMKKWGVYNDVTKGQGSILRTYNEAIMRPAVAATFGLAGLFGRGMSAAVSGLQAGGEEAGLPRDISALPEAFPLFGAETGGLHGVPTLSRGEMLGRELGREMDRNIPTMTVHLSANEVDNAADLGLIGPKSRQDWAGYSGPVTATQDSMSVRARVAGMQEDAKGQPPATEAPLAPRDIHEAARTLAPSVFAQFDPLALHVDELRGQIAEAQDALRRNAEAQAPHQAEIADLQERLQDATPRLAKKYEARLADLIPARDAFLADDFTMSSLTRDTPEILAMRDGIQAAHERMADLAPEVTAAYREAAKQFPETQAEPEPAAVPETPAAVPVSVPAEAAAVPAGEPAAPPVVPAGVRPEPAAVPAAVPVADRTAVPPAGAVPPQESTPVAPINIREDVAQKLMAAGRPEAEARAAAEVVAAGYEARAARFGGQRGSAEDLYRAEAPDVVAGRTSAKARALELAQRKGRTMMQTAPVARLTGEEIAPLSTSREDLRPLAESWYDSVLRKGPPAKTVIGDVTFTRTGRRKIRAFSADPNKLRLLPAVRDILERGDYLGREAPNHPRTDGIVAFHRFAADVDVAGAMQRAHVLVSEDEYGNKFYDMNAERDTAIDQTQKPGTANIPPEEPSDPATGRTLNQEMGAADDDVNLHLSSPRELDQTTRGKININDGRSVITLMGDANASTFIHETGHDWLEKLTADAKHPLAPAQLVADAKTVRDWLGAAPDAEITRAQHEKFARGFERYLMEGIAPSRALAGVFAQFKQWLTSIYQTVTRLHSPVNDNIRGVFDRMLATPDEQAVIAPERAAQPSLDLAGHASVPREASPYLPAGKEPTRLVAFLRRKTVQFPGTAQETTIPGGVRDPGGDISSIIGGPKGMPGLINNATGSTINDAMVRAWENGYYPEFDSIHMMEDNDLFRKIEEDVRGNAQYSMHDQDRVEAWLNAKAHNSEIDRLANEHGIDPKGMTLEKFYEAVTEKLSLEEQAHAIKDLETTNEAEYEDMTAETQAWLADHDIPWNTEEFYGLNDSRTLEDLEAERGQEAASRSAGQGEAGAEPSPAAAAHQGQGEAGGGQRGRDPGDPGRADAEEAEGSADPDPAERGAPHAEAQSEQPAGPHGAVEEPSSLVDKAGNIRLDNLNSEDDVKQLLRDLAAQNDDFMVARGGVIPDVQRKAMADACGLTIDNFNPQKPENVSSSVWADAVQTVLFQSTDAATRLGKVAGESGSPADLAAYLAAKQRVLMIADHFSTLTAEAGRTLRVFDKKAFSFTGDMVAMMERDTGKTLYQLQQEARAVGAMETTAQRARMMQDTREPTRGQQIKSGIISYFINNLISGPITHAAYTVGNVATALFKAVPLTLAEASIDTARAAMNRAPLADRVYFGEVGAQVYGAMHGAWSGFSPGYKAFKTGISYMEGAQRLADAKAGSQVRLPGLSPLGEASLRPEVIGPGLQAAGVPEGIARPVGRALEIPSRAVSAIHTVAYSMNYEREIARRAFRAASNEGLTGDAFNTRVAQLTQDPPLGMVQAAHDEALGAVLMKRPAYGTNQQRFVQIVNDILPFKLALPFMQVGMNILDEGLVKNSPVTLLFSQSMRDDLFGRNGPVAQTQTLARLTIGQGIVAGVLTAASQGILTGAGPTDPHERALKEATGWKAYSIRIGDTYVPYRKYLGPLGALVGGTASIYEAGSFLGEGQLTKAAGAAMLGFAHVVMDESWMAGAANLADAVTHWDTDGDKYLRNMALGFIPGSVGLSQVARMTDQYQREVHSWTAAARNMLPGLSEGLMPQRDWTGTPVGSHTMMSPSVFKNDRTMAAMEAAEFYPAKIERNVRGVPLSDQQYDDLARVAGRLAKVRMDMLVSGPGFSALPLGMQNKAMHETLSSSRKVGEDWLMAQPGNANILRQSMAAKGAQLQGRLPEDVKSIRQGLEP